MTPPPARECAICAQPGQEIKWRRNAHLRKDFPDLQPTESHYLCKQHQCVKCGDLKYQGSEKDLEDEGLGHRWEKQGKIWCIWHYGTSGESRGSSPRIWGSYANDLNSLEPVTPVLPFSLQGRPRSIWTSEERNDSFRRMETKKMEPTALTLHHPTSSTPPSPVRPSRDAKLFSVANHPSSY